MKKFMLSMAGAATVLASAIALIDYADRASKKQNAHMGELVFGIVGTLAGITLALTAEKETAPRELELEEILSDSDVDLMQEHISEVLGTSAEHTETKKTLRTVAVDEETTIEDFI